MTSAERTELERIRRVADQTCSGHACLRDEFRCKALSLDVAMLALGSWLVALTFVDPLISHKLTPFGISPPIWIGVLGVINFFLGVLQLRVDWKAKSDAHARSHSLHADLKRELNIVLAREPLLISDAEYARVRAQEAMTSNSALPIPDSDFLRLKRRHKLKVAVSKHLDDHPGALIIFTKLKLLLRDNSFH